MVSTGEKDMKATFDKKALERLVSTLRTVTDEATLVFDAGAVYGEGLDAAHVMVVGATVPVGADDAHKFEAGFKLSKMADIIKASGPSIAFDLTDTIVVKSGNITRKMQYLNGEVTKPKVPKLNLETKIQMPLADFVAGIKAAGTVNDHAAIRVDGGVCHFETVADSGADSIECAVTLENASKTKARSLFPNDYLGKVAASARGAETIKIAMGNDLPARFDWEWADGGAGWALVAPRIEG